jgi:CrcB protein
MTWLLVGLGGAMGATARHAVNRVLMMSVATTGFPFGTFLINVVGSGLIGLIAGCAAGGRIAISNEARTFLMVGFLGGFTTFSSFSLDTLTLLKGGEVMLAVANVAGQVGLSLLAVLLCYRLGLRL